MKENVLIMTSKSGESLEKLLQTSDEILENGNHVRLLLFGDGVSSATCVFHRSVDRKSYLKIEILACKEDLESRGLARKVEPGIKIVDYDEIVELLMKNDDRIVNYV